MPTDHELDWSAVQARMLSIAGKCTCPPSEIERAVAMAAASGEDGAGEDTLRAIVGGHRLSVDWLLTGDWLYPGAPPFMPPFDPAA